MTEPLHFPRTARAIGLLVALLVLLALSACGGQPKSAAAPAAPLRVATTVSAEHAQQAQHDQHDQHASLADTADHTDHADHPQPLAATELPGTSIFHLATTFTDQHRRQLALADLRGQPSVFVMFYGDCNTACPLLVRSAQEIEAALPEDLKHGTQFVMVSFDTERDTPDKLLTYAQDKGLDKENWHWLVGSPLQTRQLATLLGVQFRDGGNGVFAHSNVVTVIDPHGVPTARLEGLGVKLEPALAAIQAAGAAH